MVGTKQLILGSAATTTGAIVGGTVGGAVGMVKRREGTDGGGDYTPISRAAEGVLIGSLVGAGGYSAYKFSKYTNNGLTAQQKQMARGLGSWI